MLLVVMNLRLVMENFMKVCLIAQSLARMLESHDYLVWSAHLHTMSRLPETRPNPRRHFVRHDSMLSLCRLHNRESCKRSSYGSPWQSEKEQREPP